MEKLGVENIKITLKEVMELSIVVHRELKDGFQWTDILPLVPEFRDIPVIITSGKIAFQEMKDLDPSESQEIADWFQDKFDIENDELEGKIEEALQLLAESHLYVTQGIGLVTKWADWGKSLSSAEEE